MCYLCKQRRSAAMRWYLSGFFTEVRFHWSSTHERVTGKKIMGEPYELLPTHWTARFILLTVSSVVLTVTINQHTVVGWSEIWTWVQPQRCYIHGRVQWKPVYRWTHNLSTYNYTLAVTALYMTPEFFKVKPSFIPNRLYLICGHFVRACLYRHRLRVLPFIVKSLFQDSCKIYYSIYFTKNKISGSKHSVWF